MGIARTIGQRIPVSLGERSYDIVVEPGVSVSIGESLWNLRLTGKIGIVTDRHVARHYLKRTADSLKQAGLEPVPIILPPGERSKTLATIARILDVLARHKFERRSMLLALGGGVVGDLAGFAAAIYQRGIPFVQVPTTLVAQVDSSVGGKTGVDHVLGKNLIGAFHQPRAVFIDPDTLRTLPRREWVAGLAEVIKYGIIADESFFSFLEESMPGLLKLEESAVRQAIVRSCEIKAQVVAEDERESDRRRILNYGHTIGHALESLGGYRGLIHGEAVGIGLVQEADLAVHLGVCERDVVTRIRRLVQAAGLPDRMPTTSFSALWQAMQHDKKVVGGKVVGVWPVRIGEVVIRSLEQQACADWHRTLQTNGPNRSSKRVRRIRGGGRRHK
ncbi:MAG TPA: 3-dehydroquinate synthase [Pyrinomonadaceae bacterium]|nr:3-dehydroquinate synthase [Pyrinomonadaceae bacterium]